jgi:DNA sulfur modification protein DndE
MFKSIKTSETNRAIVTELTNKLGLGPENLIARLAFSLSISHPERMELSNIKDSKGKEYSSNVLFGSYLPLYVAIICEKYEIPKIHPDVGKYVKMHVDDGLERMHSELEDNPNLSLFDYLMDKILSGISSSDLRYAERS